MVGAEVAPFGTYRPNAMQRIVLALSSLPLLRRGFFRKISMKIINLFGSEPFDIARDKARYRLTPSDNVAERGILLNPVYQEKSLKFLRDKLVSGGQMVDCGANIGQYSLVGAQCVGKHGKLLAVEATSAMAKRLRQNVELSGMGDIIRVEEVAAGGEEGTISFDVNETDGALSRASENGTHVIAMRPLLDLVKDAELTAIDLLKIDVEGMEDVVLNAFFKDAPQKLWPQHIIIEDELSDKWDDDVSSLLTKHGYREAKERSAGNAFFSLQ